MDPQARIVGPRISWRELLEAVRTLLQRSDRPPPRPEELRRVIDPWEDDLSMGYSHDSESPRGEVPTTALVRAENRLSDAASTALEVTSRLMAPAGAAAGGHCQRPAGRQPPAPPRRGRHAFAVILHPLPKEKFVMTATLNGRPRKQLSEQIDRLDRILDTLADGFQEIVAQAAEDGAKIGATTVLQELLSHPTLQTLIAHATLPPPTPREPPRTPRVVERLRTCLRQLRSLLGAILAPLGRRAAAPTRRVRQAGQSLLWALQLAWAGRWGTLTAILLGSLAALIGYHAPPALAAALCGVSGLGLTLTGYALVPLVGILRRHAD